MVSIVQCGCVFPLTSCDKMPVQDTHREHSFTLIMSDVTVIGPRMSIFLENNFSQERKEEIMAMLLR